MIPDKCSHEASSHSHHEENVANDAGNKRDSVRGIHDTPPPNTKVTVFRIDSMDCPTEEALLRAKLDPMHGVVDLQFNLIQRTLTIYHILEDVKVFSRTIEALGMKPEEIDAMSPSGMNDAVGTTQAKPWWPLAFACCAAIGAELSSWFLPGMVGLPILLAFAAVVFGGLPTYKKGWIAIKNRNLNINALMSIAVTGAFILQQWPEAAMVMVLFAIAERIEAASLERARNAIRGLMLMTPDYATIQLDDGIWQRTPVNDVVIGAVVRLKPGERVPLDGTLLRGESFLDQSPITGESIPVQKVPGDPLFAGTINQDSELEYTVTAGANDSTLARIIHAVEAAQQKRAPTQRFVDQFSKIYTPVILLIAFLVAIIPTLVFGGASFIWVYKALILLVIACPCALVISTPITIVSGLAAAARHGILIKGGTYLEQGRELTWLAFDKTGTITHGKPKQTDSIEMSTRAPHAYDIAYSLAARSDHPISKAIAAYAHTRNHSLQVVSGFTALAGRGVKGTVAGVDYHLGNHRLIEELNLCSPLIEAQLNTLERQGKTAVLLTDNEGVLLIVGVADTVKETSRQAIGELHQLGIKTLMLSGDNPHTVRAIAEQVGIDEACGDQLPGDKAEAVAKRRALSGKIGMVGDGINDAPALARADIGFAMGAAGSDTAIETADVALMDDDLRKIPTFIQLSRATSTILKQNITLSISIKAVFLVFTLIGMSTMWMAVFADMGASLLVVFNGLRLLRK